MFKGFRDFVLRGNVVDLAVAVIIGAAKPHLVRRIVTRIMRVEHAEHPDVDFTHERSPQARRPPAAPA